MVNTLPIVSAALLTCRSGIEHFAMKGKRAPIRNEIVAYCHIIPFVGVTLVIIQEFTDIVLALVVYGG